MAIIKNPPPAELVANLLELADRIERAQWAIVTTAVPEDSRVTLRSHVTTITNQVLDDVRYLADLVADGAGVTEPVKPKQRGVITDASLPLPVFGQPWSASFDAEGEHA